MPKNLPYRESTVFAVPLATGGKALGLIARMAPKGKLIFGYFFPSCNMPDVYKLTAKDAVLVGRFGDLHLIDGRWQILGEWPNWNRQDWPLPSFLKIDPLDCLPDQVVSYDEEDLSLPGRWERVERIQSDLPHDGLMGAGFVEKKLDLLISRSGS